MSDELTLTIYTAENVLEFNVPSPSEEFEQELAESIASGLTMVTLTTGEQLIINMNNIAAVEIAHSDTPPENEI